MLIQTRHTKLFKEGSADDYCLGSCFFIHYLGCVKARNCELNFGIDYQGNIRDHSVNAPNWERRGAYCFETAWLNHWSWEHPKSTVYPLTRWLKETNRNRKVSINSILGAKKCGSLPTTSSYCVPDYGREYAGPN